MAIGEKEYDRALAEEEQVQEAVGKDVVILLSETDENENEPRNVPNVKRTDAVTALSLSIQWSEENNLPMLDIYCFYRGKENFTEKSSAARIQAQLDNCFLRKLFLYNLSKILQ